MEKKSRPTGISVAPYPAGERGFARRAPLPVELRLMSTLTGTREGRVRHGIRLQYFTIAYNSLEGLISVTAGLFAGSVSLIGFGFDSLIEVTSGAAVLWRLRRDRDSARRERAERATVRVVGWCFMALAAYILCDSGSTLLRREPPDRSIPGIVVAAVSLVAMPLLARAKRRVAGGIGSAAMKADSRQTDFCAYLSAILLCGLLLNALFGWWWADPAAALVMVPIIANEGVRSLRGEACCDTC
jgi:divalent metal cation (Fe/Co/Zn/Cd) transporter